LRNLAQRKLLESASNKWPGLKIGNDHELENTLKIIYEKHSPDAVIECINATGLKFKNIICTKVLYDYID